MGCCLTDRKKQNTDNDGPVPTDAGIGETEEEKKLAEHFDKLDKEMRAYQEDYYSDIDGLPNDGDKELQGFAGIFDKIRKENQMNGSFRSSKENFKPDRQHSIKFRREDSITDIPMDSNEPAPVNKSGMLKFEKPNFSFSEVANKYNKSQDNTFNNNKAKEELDFIVTDRKYARQKSGMSNETASFMEENNMEAEDREGYFTFENNLAEMQKFSLNMSTMTGISRKQDESYSFLENSIENLVEIKHSNNHSTYFSINSTSIIGNNYYTEDRPAHVYQEQHDVAKLFCRNFIFFYFEFHYFSLWGKEYLSAIYPELNLIMVIEINDSKVTQEKIPLVKSKKKEKVKEVRYYPELKKQDLNTKVYRIIQAFDVNQSNRNSFPFKINISFYTFTNHKMLLICNDEFFLRATREGEMQKYTMLRNTYARHYHKKLGNLLFNFCYKSDDLSPSELDYEKQKMLKNFFELKDFSKFEENSELNFNYYGIENLTFRENGGEENGDITYNPDNLGNLIEKDDIRNENNIEKLLDFLMSAKKKFEFYQILKRLTDFMSTSEFREGKLIKFKEILVNRLQETADKIDSTDKILVPFIFGTLKNAFFKTQSQNGGGSRYNKKKGSSRNQNDEKNKQKNLDIETSQQKNVDLLTNCLIVAFAFLRNDIHEDVCLSALNYIHRNLEEFINIPVNSKNIPIQEYFLNFIVEKKLYTKFFDTLFRYYEYNACVQPIFIIFRKILKSYKDKVPEIIQLFNNDKFKEIFKKVIKTHDCNGLVMTNIFHILQHLAITLDSNYITSIIPFERLKEVFSIFKNYGYEQFHESAVNMIKVALLRRISKGGELSSKQTFNTSVVIDVSNEEHSEIVQIFASALTLMNRKLLKMENLELRDWINTMLSHVNIFCNVLQCASPSNKEKAIQSIIDRKVFDLLLDAFLVLRERNVIKLIEALFKQNLDLVFQMKISLLRTLYHLMDLFIALNVYAFMLKSSVVDKVDRLLEAVRENDNVYNPEEITRSLSKQEDMLNEETYKSIKKIEYYYAKFNQKCREFFWDPSEVAAAAEKRKNSKQK